MTNTINQFVIELEINSPRERTWQLMIEKIDAWWPVDFRGVPGGSTLTLEAYAGGRFYEEAANGGSLLWGQVLCVLPNQSIDLAGHVSPTFGGPNVTHNRLALADTEEGRTKFTLTNTVMGNFAERGEEQVKAGWNYLLAALKSFVESA